MPAPKRPAVRRHRINPDYRRVAYHEAGHALLFSLCGGGVRSAELNSSGGATCALDPEKITGTASMAGVAAEQVFGVEEEGRQAIRQREAEREQVRKATSYDPGLSAEALLNGESEPGPTPAHTRSDEFDRLTGEIQTLRPHVIRREKEEKRARRNAVARIAEGYTKARDENVKAFHSTLEPQYRVGTETAAMVRHLQVERGEALPSNMLAPRPAFQRNWLISRAAEFNLSDGLPIPPSMLADPYAVERLKGLKVKIK